MTGAFPSLQLTNARIEILMSTDTSEVYRPVQSFFFAIILTFCVFQICGSKHRNVLFTICCEI